MKRALVVGIALFALVANAAIGVLVIDEGDALVQNGLVVSTAANYSSNNQVTNMLYGSLDFDFAALTATAGCLVSTNGATVHGAAVGDPCFVAVDEQAADAGTVSQVLDHRIERPKVYAPGRVNAEPARRRLQDVGHQEQLRNCHETGTASACNRADAGCRQLRRRASTR